MISSFFSVVALALVGFIGWIMWTGYRSAPGIGFKRWINAAEGSATILWQYVLIVAGALLGSINTMADWLNMPAVQDFVHNNLPASYVGIVLVGISFVTVLARLRTL